MSYPVLSAEEHDEVPEQTGRVPVQQVVVARTLQGFALGELDNIHLMCFLPDEAFCKISPHNPAS